jgi:hypothetical protein
VGLERGPLSLVSTNEELLHGLSPQANYTDRTTAACQRNEDLLQRKSSGYGLETENSAEGIRHADPRGTILPP